MFKRYAAALAVSTALTFVIPAGVNAASFETSTTAVQIGDVSYYRSETTADSIRFAHVLSSHYNRTIPTSEVIRLRADFDFGFGDISMMYTVADYCGLPVHDVVGLRRKNLGWGEIAKIYGVKVKDLKRHHDLFVDDAHVHGIDIDYIKIEDFDRHDNDYHDHDRDKDKNDNKRFDNDRDQNRNHDERYERYEQDKNNDKHDKDKGNKQGNKKDYEQNGNGNGRK